MPIEQHIKQNTASIFDLTVIEFEEIDLETNVMDTKEVPEPEVMNFLDEYKFKYLKTFDFSYLTFHFIETQCGCTQALVKVAVDKIKSLSTVVDAPACDDERGFNFTLLDDVNIYSVDASVYLKVGDAVHVTDNLVSDTLLSVIFDAAHPQSVVEEMQDLMKEVSSLRKEREQMRDLLLAKSNIGNYPAELHARLHFLSFDRELNEVAIAPKGHHYLRTLDGDKAIVYIPMINKQLIEDVNLVMTFDDEVVDLFLRDSEPEEATIFCYEFGEHKLVQEYYHEYSIVGIEISKEEYLVDFEARQRLVELVDSLTTTL